LAPRTRFVRRLSLLVSEPDRTNDPWLAFVAWGVIAASVLVYFHNIAGTSLWNDEGFSFFTSARTFAATIAAMKGDTQPPFYYLVLTAWLGFGHGALAMRSLSAVAMSVAALFVYLSARDLFGRKLAVVAVLLFVINPYGVMWAQKARPYALQTMLVAVSFWGFAGITLADRARSTWLGSGIMAAIKTRTWSIAATDVRWAAYVLGGGLAMLTQHPAGFFVLGCNGAMLAWMVTRPDGARLLLCNWIIAQIILSAIWLLWLPAFLGQVSNDLTPERIKESHAIFLVSLSGLRVILGNVLGVASTWKIQPLLLAFNVAIAAIALYSAIRFRNRNGLVFLVVLVPLLVCLAAYFLVHPVFGYVIYTFCWLIVPYCMMLAFGMSALRPPVLRWLVLLLAIAANLRGLQNYYAERPPPLDVIAKYIGDHAQPGDAVMYSDVGSTSIALAYYLKMANRPLAGVDVSWSGETLIANANDAFQHPRDWMILPDGEAPAVALAVLESRMTLGFDQHFGSIRVMRFDRRD
jgi:4-amino-4-deoxy-L-arabinose transferase-like glycosyltransferase